MKQAFVSRVRSPFIGIVFAALTGYLITAAIPWSEIEPVYRLPLSMPLLIVLGVGIGRMCIPITGAACRCSPPLAPLRRLSWRA